MREGEREERKEGEMEWGRIKGDGEEREREGEEWEERG